MDRITGSLTPVGTLSGALSSPGGLSGSLTMPELVPVEEYDGAYTVTPRLAEQTLETQGKKMRADILVHQIPVVRTSNPHGGQTVLIG